MIVLVDNLHGIGFSLKQFTPKDKKDAKEFNHRLSQLIERIADDLLEITLTKKVKS